MISIIKLDFVYVLTKIILLLKAEVTYFIYVIFSFSRYVWQIIRLNEVTARTQTIIIWKDPICDSVTSVECSQLGYWVRAQVPWSSFYWFSCTREQRCCRLTHRLRLENNYFNCITSAYRSLLLDIGLPKLDGYLSLRKDLIYIFHILDTKYIDV